MIGFKLAPELIVMHNLYRATMILTSNENLKDFQR